MRKTWLAVLGVMSLATSAQAGRLTFYLSPSGSDSRSGLSANDPMRTFERAFSVMEPGDELVLLDGTYGEASGTGYISYAGLHSAQPPSGRPDLPTLVRAQNPSGARMIGGLFLGRSFRTDSDITIQGITFEGLADGTGGSAGNLYNAQRVTLKDCGFHSAEPMASAILRLGAGEGALDADNRLEDVWIWGRAPAALSLVNGRGLTIRRTIVRLEGGSRPLFVKDTSLSLDSVLDLADDAARWLSPAEASGPWPDEDVIRKELCVDPGVSRGFCAWKTLSLYLQDVRPGHPALPSLVPAAARLTLNRVR